MGYCISTKFMIAANPTNGKNAVINTIERAKKALLTVNRFSIFDAEIDADETRDLFKELPFDGIRRGPIAGHTWRCTVLTNERPVKYFAPKVFADRLQLRNDDFDDFDQNNAKADFIDNWVQERLESSETEIVHNNMMDMPWLLAMNTGSPQDIVDLAHTLYMTQERECPLTYASSHHYSTRGPSRFANFFGLIY